MKSIVLVATENGALPGGKVGGIGDVVHHLPVALADRGWRPTVLTPAYGRFSKLPKAQRLKRIAVPFGGVLLAADLFELPGLDERIRHLAVEHPLFQPDGTHQIYHDDGPGEPFRTDSTKFAFFCAAAGVLLPQLKPDVVHLHDWHTGLLLALREFEPDFNKLKTLPIYFTIHNLALQGIRPLTDHPASLSSWFPGHAMARDVVADPRYEDCVNPLLTAIRLADRVHTVSPTYATEILRPESPDSMGGAGLELALREADEAHRLVGILNGCDYPNRKPRRLGWKRLLKAIRAELMQWIGQSALLQSTHWLAERRMSSLPERRPRHVLTSVGRLTDQKLRILLGRTADGDMALVSILDLIGSDGLLIILGTGSPGYEQALREVAAGHSNFLFLNGYSDAMANALFQAGDLFLMPSSFEPCGISQMLAMRAGQPCIVHDVGGLRDTVEDGRTGFVFSGRTLTEQASNMVASVRDALHMRSHDRAGWRSLKKAASKQRFTWDHAAAAYEKMLYQTDAE